MDWFLYDNGLRYERVKNMGFYAATLQYCYLSLRLELNKNLKSRGS